MNSEFSGAVDGFRYAFRVERVYEYFQRLPEETQFSVERNITNVIYESFVVPADEDYLMARLLAQKGLYRGFFWAASQALEKYFKAFLLMRDQGVKEFSRGHPLEELFSAVSEHDPSISDISLALHNDLNLDDRIACHVTMFTMQEFMGDLAIHGAASNRYNASGVSFNTGHLLALDAFVSQIRERIGVVGIKDSLKGISEDVIKTFYGNNFYFAPSSVVHSLIPSPEFSIQSSMAVTWLDFLQKHSDHQTCSIALLWLAKKMKL